MEERLAEQMVELMRGYDAPPEQFTRIGLALDATPERESP